MSADSERLLSLARERFRTAQEAESRIREHALEDLRFRAGQQWPEQIRAARELERRPCLTINRLPQFIKQVTNEQRQNRPSIFVHPVDDQGDPETAEVLQGIVRHIEANSDAEIAYDTAFEHAATFGFGYFRVLTEYVSEESFDQEIRIERVRNPFTVYFDPACRRPDYSDARFAFVVEELTHEEFKALYPGSEIAGLQDFGSIGDRAAGWLSRASVRIAEYWWVEEGRREIVLMADGSVAPAEDVPPDAPVLRKRTVAQRRVRWAKINGVEVLEQGEWAGKWIPIIPVLGDELDIDGERDLVGLVRYAKDPQRMYNYWATAETEMIALAPKAPWVAAEGQIEGYEHLYRDASTRNIAVLPYKPKALGNVLVPPPQRMSVEPPIMAITSARMQSADDLKATTGIYDASLGARGNETSGRAILARQREGDVANYHLADNLRRSIKHLGRVLIDLIAKVYDTPRVLRILGRDDEPRMVAVNQEFAAGGVAKIYDLTTGRYDVRVDVGPSFSSRRQEAVESMMQLTQAYPQLVSIAGDLMVRNMDWPGAAEIAERLKRMLPEQLREQADGPVPAEVQAQMQAMQQQLEQLAGELQAAHETIRTKQIEAASRERIAALQVEADLLKAEAQLNGREGVELLRREIAQLREQLQAAADQPAAALTAADPSMADPSAG